MIGLKLWGRNCNCPNKAGLHLWGAVRSLLLLLFTHFWVWWKQVLHTGNKEQVFLRMPVWVCIQPLLSVPRPPNYQFFFLWLESWYSRTAAEWIIADVFPSELLAAKLWLDLKFLKRSRQVFLLLAYGCNYLVAEKFNQWRQQQHKMCHVGSASIAVRKKRLWESLLLQYCDYTKCKISFWTHPKSNYFWILDKYKGLLESI